MKEILTDEEKFRIKNSIRRVKCGFGIAKGNPRPKKKIRSSYIDMKYGKGVL